MSGGREGREGGREGGERREGEREGRGGREGEGGGRGGEGGEKGGGMVEERRGGWLQMSAGEQVWIGNCLLSLPSERLFNERPEKIFILHFQNNP